MSSEIKLFSIIIATYNVDKVLQKTIDSVKQQNDKNYELIIIDGESSDNTVEVIKSNSEFITHWISEIDDGIYDAWNKGIKISNGEWILFLGAGDLLVPDALYSYKLYLDSLENTTLNLVSAKINRTTEDGRFISIKGSPWSWSKFKNSMTIAHVGALHNNALFNEVGLYDQNNYKICADYELLMRKRDKLKAGFLNHVIGDMPIGGMSFSVQALKEIARLKYKTGKQNLVLVIIYFIYSWILFKTYSFRHRKSILRHNKQ